MKEIRIDLPEDIEQIELHPLADLHIGDGLCDFKLIQEKNLPEIEISGIVTSRRRTGRFIVRRKGKRNNIITIDLSYVTLSIG